MKEPKPIIGEGWVQDKPELEPETMEFPQLPHIKMSWFDRLCLGVWGWFVDVFGSHRLD